MGKYMKKSRTAGDVAVASSSLGVRTRANTLKPPPSPPQITDGSAYLQLRSRLLLKLPPPPRKESAAAVANSRLKENSAKTASSVSKSGKLEPKEENVDLGMEGSFGENFLEDESRDRSTRESTPCSLIRDSNVITTPGSTTRQRTHQINQENVQRIIPTAHEMDEFFSYAERQQQAMFMEKYNFDIVNDVPLPGRYEWVRVLN